MLQLVKDGYNKKTDTDRSNYGLQLKKALEDFTNTFLPHMQEEEEVCGQPAVVLKNMYNYGGSRTALKYYHEMCWCPYGPEFYFCHSTQVNFNDSLFQMGNLHIKYLP